MQQANSRLFPIPNQANASKARPADDEQVVQVVGETRESASDHIPLSQSSAQDEYCPIYGDLYVAYDTRKKKLVCNQCIYNDVEDTAKQLEHLTFTSYVASDLKELFDEKFAAYKDSLKDMNKIAPKVISSTLESTV